MRRLALVLGALFAGVGFLGVLAPSIILSIARQSITPVGIWVVTALRIVVGIILLLGASGARSPLILRFLGTLVLVGGVATPWIGAERGRALVDWWASGGDGLIRLWSCVALTVGLFIDWAATRAATTAPSSPS